MAKSESIRIRVAANEKDAFQKAAELSGLSLSTWIRERLRRIAIKEFEDSGKRVPFIAPIPLGGPDDQE